MVRLLRIFGILFSLSLRRHVAFRADLVFALMLTAINLFATLTALAMVFSRTSSLSGWSADQAVTLVGTFQIVSGLREAFVEPSLRWLGKQVQEGEFDALLTQPAPAVFLTSFSSCAPLALTQTVLGAGVVGYGLARQHGMTPARIIAWAVLVLCGAVIMWAVRALLAAVVFWALNFDLDIVYDGLWRFAGYPISIYRRPLRLFLTYVIPLAVVSTLPASVATRSASLAAVPVGAGAAVLLCLLTVTVWHLGVARYTSATS
ncbi:MAG: ABC transporter permease [Mycobacteriales bacterium]